MKLLLLICAVIIISAVVYGYSMTRHPYITATKNIVSGLSALFLINITSGATGCYIAINSRTVFMATVLSLPGVFALLIMKLLFSY